MTASAPLAPACSTCHPYSPDLNPIDQAFAKLMALLPKAAARTTEALWTAIGRLPDAFTPAEYRNYLANSDYAFE